MRLGDRRSHGVAEDGIDATEWIQVCRLR